ncbi:MAG: 50S ribosomal protein L21e [Candidatus Woesearchaeota archaeon]|jgi:large subunit ribosomal protein L21e|nr:50S ribosomal protein L21e [Candidatus Woesearchaeota archaeon]
MAKHHAGFRRKTRGILSKNFKRKGKISLKAFFQELKEGEKVVLKAEPAYQNGMYYPRFHGKGGMIMGRQGHCYKVLIQDGKKDKLLLVHPVHLKRF